MFDGRALLTSRGSGRCVVYFCRCSAAVSTRSSEGTSRGVRPLLFLKVSALRHQAQRLRGESNGTSDRRNLSSHLSVTGPREGAINADKEGFVFFSRIPIQIFAGVRAPHILAAKNCTAKGLFVDCWVGGGGGGGGRGIKFFLPLSLACEF